MRKLDTEELTLIAGGDGAYACTPAQANNVYYGIANPPGLGGDLISIYEGVVMATSHVMERVIKSFD